MCLISEILFEYKEDVREHLPALLHILTITLDSTQSILQQHSQQVSCFYKGLSHQISAAVEQKLRHLCVLQALLNLVYSFTTQRFGEQHGPSNEVCPGLLQS